MCESLSTRLHIVNAQVCVITIEFYSLAEIKRKEDEEEDFIFY